MAIGSHLDFFNKKKTAWFEIEDGIKDANLAYRIATEYDADEDDFENKLLAFCNDEKAKDVKELIIGVWFTEFDDDSSEAIQLLVENKDKLPSLEALMIGDITYEENEVSWIEQSDINAVFGAFPNLKNLHVRGGNGLELGKVAHQNLETLMIETGGLDKSVIHQIAKADLPKLNHLELWLGDENYGWNGDISDIKLLYKKDLFPNLTYLGLKNSEMANEIAESLLGAEELIGSIQKLDMEGGTMTDEGAEHLLKNTALNSLGYFSVESNFISDEMVEKLESTIKAKSVDASGQKEDEDGDWYYVDLGE